MNLKGNFFHMLSPWNEGLFNNIKNATNILEPDNLYKLWYYVYLASNESNESNLRMIKLGDYTRIQDITNIPIDTRFERHGLYPAIKDYSLGRSAINSDYYAEEIIMGLNLTIDAINGGIVYNNKDNFINLNAGIHWSIKNFGPASINSAENLNLTKSMVIDENIIIEKGSNDRILGF